MMLNFVRVRSLFVAGICFGALGLIALAQKTENRIVGPIDEGQVVTLTGNVHPQARGEFDLGMAEPETVLERMVLELEPSAAQQAELDALVEAQHDPQSPLYQQWLTPAEYGARFGASAGDVARITTWLRGHGFRVDEVAASNRLIQFSGTAADVTDAFHTEIHRYKVDGVEHIANVQDPQIPVAFSGVVGGVLSLHDFRRNSQISERKPLIVAAEKVAAGVRTASDAAPEYTSGSTHYLYPSDWATIYDSNSLYSAGKTGTGASIAIVGRSNINLSDVTTFRAASGLPANAPTITYVSANPGLLQGDQDESTLDVEWSGATAPGAAVKFVVGASTATTDGVDLSAQYIVNHATATVVSTSYGSCEQDMGSTELAFYNRLWQQAASEGISAFVSSGDSGAAGCNGGSSSTGSGKGVNGLCSSPYSTCVGGTGFNEGSGAAKYWATTNSSTYESGTELHSGRSLERERAGRRLGIVGFDGRSERDCVPRAGAGKTKRCRNKRGERYACGAGCGHDRGQPRWVHHCRGWKLLGDCGHFGGFAVVRGRDGAGGAGCGRQGAGMRESWALCAAECVEESVSCDAFGEQQRAGRDGIHGQRRGI